MAELEFGVTSAILVWDYDHLPEPIKEFMEVNNIRNDDIDWIALRPKIYEHQYINWLEEPQFGCYRVEERPIGVLGYTLVLGYHA